MKELTKKALEVDYMTGALHGALEYLNSEYSGNNAVLFKDVLSVINYYAECLYKKTSELASAMSEKQSAPLSSEGYPKEPEGVLYG